MLLSDLFEMSVEQLPLLQSELSLIFDHIGVNIIARPHFLDRCTDGNIDKDNNIRGDLIQYDDVLYTSSKFIQKYKDIIDRKQHWGGIIRDRENHINIIFAMSTKKRSTGRVKPKFIDVKTIQFVTIMKIENFRKADTMRFYDV
jgi:hypothetical protein